MSDDAGERRALVREIARTVLARLAEESAAPVPGPLPCAIPPPGTPHYAAAMKPAAAGGAKLIALPAGRELARMIDHTLLKPEATPAEIERLCDEALRWGFATVCVHSSYVALCARRLAGSPVGVCSVAGFPLGAASTEAKVAEARAAIAAGAAEIDMVLHAGFLKSGDYARVVDDIRAVVDAAGGKTIKVILETGRLSEEEKIAGCLSAREAGAHFVKTSTGFGPGGATAEDVRLMRRVVGASMGVKASGGIRDLGAAQRMIEAGASRLGTSASVSLVAGAG